MIIPDQQQLKQYTIIHQDGTQEVVYMSATPNGKVNSLKDHLMVSYVVVGTVALALTAYLTYLQLKKM